MDTQQAVLRSEASREFLDNAYGLATEVSTYVENETNKNLFHIDRWEDIIKYLDSINHNATYIKNVVIDDKLCA